MWLADMDFATHKPILDTLHKYVDRKILGYSNLPNCYYQRICEWHGRRFHWNSLKEQIIYTGNVMGAVVAGIRAFTDKGDAMLFFTPGYPAFAIAAEANKRRLVACPLKQVKKTWIIDFGLFEQKIISNHIKIFVLCSPHNPTGRSWTESELAKIVGICYKYHVIIISDEIHADLTYHSTHLPLASLSSSAFESIEKRIPVRQSFCHRLSRIFGNGSAIIPRPFWRISCIGTVIICVTAWIVAFGHPG